MKKIEKKLVILLVAAMLALSAGCGKATLPLGHATPEPTATPVPVQTALPSSHRAGVRFSDMQYERPDVEAIESALNTLQQHIDAGEPMDALIEEYNEARALYDAADSEMALAYLLYAFDVTKPYYNEEYTGLQTELNRIDLMMTDVSMALFSSSEDAERTARASLGDGYVDTVYEEESLNSEEIQTLMNEEQKLITEYDRLASSFTVSDGATSYTFDDIMQIPMDRIDEYYRLYDLYTKQFNQAAGEIFLKLVALRAEIASTLGYGSYAAYRYDCYGRDYSVQDAAALHAAVKAYIVPVYRAAFGYAEQQTYASDATEEKLTLSEKLALLSEVVGYLFNSQQDEALDSYDLSQQTYALEPFLTKLRTAAADFSPVLYESLDYMLENDLCDFSVDPNKMEGSFTTYISAYRAPFLFTQWTNDAGSIQTTIHELGHFTNYDHNPAVGWSSSDSLDLAEVDSQALQLLMTPYYKDFFGELAPQAERELLIDCMYALVSGCMEDEFQQCVYLNPNMTLDEMNAVYSRIAGEYGFTELYEYTGNEWALIPHTFQSPMYYISYAASMVPALELWEHAETDAAGARDAYFRILERAPYQPFRQVVTENGLSDVFDPNTVERIGKLLNETVNG